MLSLSLRARGQGLIIDWLDRLGCVAGAFCDFRGGGCLFSHINYLYRFFGDIDISDFCFVISVHQWKGL